MVLNNKLKVYIPLMKVDVFGNLISVFDFDEPLEELIVSKYDEFITSFCKSCGGMTVYDCNGKYYNKKRDRIYSYPMKVIELFYNDYKEIEEDLISFVKFILYDLEQKEASVEINNKMLCVNKTNYVSILNTL